MNPVVGLDVSKGKSEVQGFFDKGKPYRKSFSIRHDLEGLGLLLEFLKEIKDLTGQQPPVVLESTGHYHTPVVGVFCPSPRKGTLRVFLHTLQKREIAP
jgi:hypothetical protein